MRRRSFLGFLAALPLAPAWVRARLAEEDREAILLGALSDRFEPVGDYVVPRCFVEVYDSGGVRRVLVDEYGGMTDVDSAEALESNGRGRVRPKKGAQS